MPCFLFVDQIKSGSNQFLFTMENFNFLQPEAEAEAEARTESFSFSCHSNSLFMNDGGSRSSESEESFIEIALESGSPRILNHPRNRYYEEETAQRISFSSSFPLSESAVIGSLNPDRFERSRSSTESVTFSSFQSTPTTSRSVSTRAPPDSKFLIGPRARSASTFNKTLKQRLKFPTPRNSVEDEEKFGDVFKDEVQINQGELLNGRNITNKGGMMSFFRKSKYFGAILASLMKRRQSTMPNQVSGGTGREKKRSEEILQRNRSQVMPWDKNLLVEMEQGKKKGFQMNLNSFRGAVGAMSSRFGRSESRRTLSCPSSVKSSPIHCGFTNENKMVCPRDDSYIQAAIAHCKTSLGQTSDML